MLIQIPHHWNVLPLPLPFTGQLYYDVTAGKRVHAKEMLRKAHYNDIRKILQDFQNVVRL